MLEKTIKSVIVKKINNWMESIDDENVKNVIKQNVVVTGGCFTSLMQNENPKDYDIYFKTKEAVPIVAEYYVKKFNENHVDLKNKLGIPIKAFVLTNDKLHIDNDILYIDNKDLADYLKGNEFRIGAQCDNINYTEFKGMSRMLCNLEKDRIKIFISSDGIAGQIEENNMHNMECGDDPVEIINELDNIKYNDVEKELVKEKYRPVFLSTNAITLSDGIQIVCRFYGEPETIHETYDFVHTKAYWTSYKNEIVIPKEVYEAVMNKHLIYTGSKYPLCSIVRMRKFIKRGWSINAGQILKMCMQLSDLDLKNIDVLEDQLCGVDSLYFTQLINQFKDAKMKNNDWKYDTNYVISVVDKIFG